jgi:4-hydroxy-2-oxoheptanedioate aldolase
MRENAVKRKLEAGEMVVGCFVPYPSAELAEICGLIGFDFVLIDAEHGPMSPESAYRMVLGAEAGGATPIVRVPQNVRQVILRYLDIGALGVMVPQVNSAEEARGVATAARYHPLGLRGIAGVRAAGFGLRQSLADYTVQANAEMLVIVQIESLAAVERVSEILEVPGIDVLFVGPNDLAQSMGYPGQPLHPEVQAVVDRIVQQVDGRLPLGTTAATAELAQRQRARGFRMVVTNTTSLLAASGRAIIEAVRG